MILIIMQPDHVPKTESRESKLVTKLMADANRNTCTQAQVWVY